MLMNVVISAHLRPKLRFHSNEPIIEKSTIHANITFFLKRRLFSQRLLFLKELLYIELHLADWSGRCSTPAGLAGQVRPHRRNAFVRRGGSAPAPRKASILERKSPHSYSNHVNEKSQKERLREYKYSLKSNSLFEGLKLSIFNRKNSRFHYNVALFIKRHLSKDSFETFCIS